MLLLLISSVLAQKTEGDIPRFSTGCNDQQRLCCFTEISRDLFHNTLLRHCVQENVVDVYISHDGTILAVDGDLSRRQQRCADRHVVGYVAGDCSFDEEGHARLEFSPQGRASIQPHAPLPR